jgi:Ni,Fe-hydrogenase III component G
VNVVLEQLLRRFGEVHVAEWNPRRFYLTVDRRLVVELARYFFREMSCRLSICTGSDTRAGFEILYHFSHDPSGIIYSVRTLVPKDDLQIASITPIVPAANWIEREMRELLGIEFTGHPNPTPLLTSDVDWDPDKHPLRRDYDRSCDIKSKPWEGQ